MDRFIVISGCSGGGKSSLLAEMKRRGYAVVEEPGRRIIAEEVATSDRAVPWIDLAAFARRAIEMSLRDRDRARSMAGTVFFDRGLIDAATALEHLTGEPVLESVAGERYNSRVFMTPPWPEIYVNDADRQHGLSEAIAEYGRLVDAYARLRYHVEVLPKVGVAERADAVIDRLRSSPGIRA